MNSESYVNNEKEEDFKEFERLVAASRTVVDDPSVLNHNLREACKFLSTSHRERADQVIGSMIALNSSRMLSTSWTVLLQCLRESLEVSVQLILFRHFGYIAHRISIPQRTNAFKVFAKESTKLIGSVEVVINHAFLSSFRSVLDALGVYAEKELSDALMEKVIYNIIHWQKTDGRRAAALLAAQFITSTPLCGSFTTFFDRIESNSDLLGCCIAMDASLPLLIDQAKRLTSKPLEYYTICDAKRRVDKWIDTLLYQEPLEHFTIPVIISCFEKIKLFDAAWCLSSHEKLHARVVQYLLEKETKSVLLSPFINLFGLLKLKWSVEAESIWSLTKHPDPMIRFELLRSVADTVDIMDQKDRVVLLKSAMEIFLTYMDRRCSYTIGGVVHLFSVLLPSTYQEHARTFDCVFHLLLDPTHPLSTVSSVRIQVLRLIKQLPYVSNHYFTYVLYCTHDSNGKLRSYAHSVLKYWTTGLIFDEIIFNEPCYRCIDFLEGLPSENSMQQSNGFDWFSQTRNIMLLVGHYTERLFCSVCTTAQENCQTIQTSCEALIHLSLFVEQIFVSPFGNSEPCEETFYHAFRVIQDLLLSSQLFPLDVYLSLIKTAGMCLRRSCGCADFHVFIHKGVFNHIWNILHRCCTAIDPLAAPLFNNERFLYLGWQKLLPELEEMIALSAISGLSNARDYRDTQLFQLVEQAMELFIVLLSFGNSSPVFVGHMRHFYHYAIACLDILAGSNPVTALKGCHVIFKLLFCNETVRNEIFENKEELYSEQKRFVSAVFTILTRSLTFDLVVVGEELFGFIQTLVRVDSINDLMQCYHVLDADFSLVERLVSIVCDKNYYNVVRGASVVSPILDLLDALLSSPYSSRVLNICGITRLENVLVVIDESNQVIRGDVFDCCREVVLRMMDRARGRVFDVAQLVLDDFQWDSKSEYLSVFSMYCNNAIAINKRDLGTVVMRLTKNYYLPEILMAVVLDSSLLYQAVNSALQKRYDSYFLEMLLLVMSNVSTDAVIKKANLSIQMDVLGIHDDLIAQVINAFSWGWVECVDTYVALSVIKDIRRSFSLRRALYDVAQGNHFTIPENLKESPEFQIVALSFVSCGPSLWKRYDLTSEVEAPVKASHACLTASVSYHCEINDFGILGLDEKEFLKALLPLPFFISGSMESLELLLTQPKALSSSIAEFFECTPDENAERIFHVLAENGLFSILDNTSLTALTKMLIRGGITYISLEPSVVEILLKRVLFLLESLSTKGESSMNLRYCSMFLLVLVAPSPERRWQEIFDANCLESKWFYLEKSVISIMNKSLEISLADVKGIARYVVHVLRRVSNFNQGIDESVLWLVVKCSTTSVWQAIVEEGFSESLETPTLGFLCKMNQTIGLPVELVVEVHAHYTPLLLSFGTSREMSLEQQHLALWLATSLLLHTTISEERFTKPKTHMGLTDAMPQYTDFPLDLMSSEALVKLRKLCNASTFSFYSQVPLSFTQRHCNIHSQGYLLPLCGRCTMSRSESEKVLPSLLRVHMHVLTSVFSNTASFSSNCVFDVFFSLLTLSTGNGSLLKYSQTSEGTFSSSILTYIYSWFWKYPASLVDKGVIMKRNVLTSQVGLLPDSLDALPLIDGMNTVACTTIMLNLFLPGNEKISGYVEADSVLLKLLNMDLFTYMDSITTIIIMSGSSKRKVCVSVASKVTNRLLEDLLMCRWGNLSFSFGVLQILRCACTMLSVSSDETSSMKVCEILWSSVLTKPCSRHVRHYAYYLLQCIPHMTTVGQTTTRTLCALVGARVLPSLQHRGEHSATLCTCKRTVKGYPVGVECMKYGTYLLKVRDSPLQWISRDLPYKLVMEWDRLLSLVAVASLILRSTYNELRIVEVDYNRIQVIELLDSISETPHLDSVLHPLVEELLSHVLDQEDTLYIVLNRFDSSPGSKWFLLNALEKLSFRVRKENSDMKSQWGIIMGTLKLLFESCLRKGSDTSFYWWWLICAIVNTLIGVQIPGLSLVIASMIAQLSGAQPLRILTIKATSHLCLNLECRLLLKDFFIDLNEMNLLRPSNVRQICHASEVLTTLLQVIDS